MSFVDSFFYPYRVAGKNWTSLPEIKAFLREQITSSHETIISKGTILYGDESLNSNQPIILSLRPNRTSYVNVKDLPILVLDETQLQQNLLPIIKKYGFRSVQPGDIHLMFLEMGLIGYITTDLDEITLLQSESYLQKPTIKHKGNCGCGGHNCPGW